MIAILWSSQAPFWAVAPQWSNCDLVKKSWQQKGSPSQKMPWEIHGWLVYLPTLGIQSASENGFMEPKYLAFRRWVYTPSSSSDKLIGSLGLLNLPLKNQSYCWWFRNPAPVEVSSLSYCLQGFIHLRWYRISAINSWYISANYNSF